MRHFRWEKLRRAEIDLQKVQQVSIFNLYIACLDSSSFSFLGDRGKEKELTTMASQYTEACSYLMSKVIEQIHVLLFAVVEIRGSL